MGFTFHLRGVNKRDGDNLLLQKPKQERTCSTELKSLLHQRCRANTSEVRYSWSHFSHLSSIVSLTVLPNCWCAEVHCKGVDAEANELRAEKRHL